jgi:outer membrane beta-barrel protein
MKTMRKRLFLSAAASALALLGVTSFAQDANAQEIQITGPLAGAPAVRKERLHREGRFELTPQFAFSLLDEYRQTHALGTTLQYNIKDYLSIGAFGFFTLFKPTTDLTDQIDQVADRNSRTAPNVNHTGTAAPFGTASFKDQTSNIAWFAGPQAQFAPFRGKIALFQKLFIDTDLYVHLGLAFVGVNERGDCGSGSNPSCTDPASFGLKGRTAITGTGGLGLSFYSNNVWGIRAEYRALPFAWNRAGFDSRGAGTDGKFPNLQVTGNAVVDDKDRTFRWNQVVTVGVVVAFPTAPKISE